MSPASPDGSTIVFKSLGCPRPWAAGESGALERQIRMGSTYFFG